MKYIITILAGFIAISGLVSCNKDFTCQCSFADTAKNFEIKIKKVRKNDAKVICTDYSTFVGNCSLK